MLWRIFISAILGASAAAFSSMVGLPITAAIAAVLVMSLVAMVVTNRESRMKLVIYTTTTSERLALAGNLAGYPVRVSTPNSFKADIEWFDQSNNAILILDIRSTSTGWNAPLGTIILFTGTIPDGADKWQAMSRATRVADRIAASDYKPKAP